MDSLPARLESCSRVADDGEIAVGPPAVSVNSVQSQWSMPLK